MFDALSDKLQRALGDLRGRGRLDEESVSKAMREIRLALLEADVNLSVVKEFVARVRERAVGAGRDEEPHARAAGREDRPRGAHGDHGRGRLSARILAARQTVILLAGLQGSGKTTAAAKLALLLRKDGKSPALVACDLQRPAAIDQLEQLGKQIQIPVYSDRAHRSRRRRRRRASSGRRRRRDVVIVDTAGRLQVDAGADGRARRASPTR